MTTQYTPNTALEYWQLLDPDWHLPYQNTCTKLDGMTPLGSFAVTFAEQPISTSLNVKIAPGRFRAPAGTITTYAGATVAVPASITTYLYLDASGTLVQATGWPSVLHLPLATVTAGATALISIADARMVFRLIGAGAGTAIADTTGATLAALETEVNKLKALLRGLGLLAP